MRTLLPRFSLCASVLFIAHSAWAAVDSSPRNTVLGIREAQFTINGSPIFLLGFSYYGGLGAPEEFIRRDLGDFQHHSFNWLRVWATWRSGDANISAVDTNGAASEPYLARLQALVAEADRRGLVVDVTLSRGKRLLPDLRAHEHAVETVVNALRQHRNWYLDLGNERDVGDDRYVPVSELKTLRELVRKLDPQRLVTASFGGHDLTRDDISDALLKAGLDFLSPHRPRDPKSPGQTQKHTETSFALMKEIGRLVPILYQEPFRRGYTEWEPASEDFLTDLRGALLGGAAGWCFHNGQQKSDRSLARSFDLRSKRLWEQLDAEEQKVAGQAAGMLSLWKYKTSSATSR